MENWENPDVLSDHLMPVHTWFPEEAVCLGGKWRFLGLCDGTRPPEDWTEPDFAEKKWDRITVPGAWDTAESSDPRLLKVGLYRKSFILSRQQGNRQIVLRFDSVTCPVVLWLNGIYIGKAPGNGLCAEFDITSAVKPDKNLICLMQTRGNGTTGFPGEISLYSLPARAITDLNTKVHWEEDGTPLLQLDVTVRDSEGFILRIALMDENRVISFRECVVKNGSAKAVISCPEAELWCAEQPRLYRVGVILWDGVAVYHTREVHVAFRRMETVEHTVLINGQKEKLFAVNYSAVDAVNGCCISHKRMEIQLSELREHHINAIMLQSPAPDTLYGLCDRLGIYVLDSASGQEDYAALFGNHPSILNLSGLAVVKPDAPAVSDRYRLYTLVSYAGDMDRIISQIREDDSVLGALFDDAENRRRELAALLQPIRFSYEDGTVTLTNLSRFRSTDECSCCYFLTRDGEKVVEKELDLFLAPGESKSIFIETKYDIFRSGRYHLSVVFISKKTGRTVAFGQWEVGCLPHIFDENPGGTIREDQGSLLLRSGDAAFTVNRATGFMDQIQLGERPVLAAPVGNVYIPAGEKTSGFLRASEWERLNSGRRTLKPSVFEVDHMTRTVSATYRIGSGLIQSYRLFSDGSISWELRLRTGRTAPSLLGVCIPVDLQMDRLSWFGFGPEDVIHENQAGCHYGIHHQRGCSPAAGAKEPVYQASVTDNTGFGLMIRSDEGLRLSLLKGERGNLLRLEMPCRDLTPHTTYTFAFTVKPVQK